jgi:hypothetical protein
VEAMKDSKRILQSYQTADKLVNYRNDPHHFMLEVLGDQRFTDEIVGVMESVRDNPITIARSANSVGKSFCASRLAIWFYSVYADSQVYMTAAPPEGNLRNILWAHVARIARDKPALFSGHLIRRLRVERHPESFMQGVSIPLQGTSAEREAKFSGRHAPHLMFIVDEGDAVPEEVYKGIDGCMSSGFVRLLIMFNPRAPQGYIYDLEKRGGANVIELSSLDHPNVKTGRDIIPGAVSRDVTVKRFNEWTRPLAIGEQPDQNCVKVPEFLVGETAVGNDGRTYPPLQAGERKITVEEFWYKTLGKYPSQGSRQLISEEWISNARTRYDLYVAMYGDRPPEGVRPRVGLDCAEFGSDNNSLCARYGGYVAPFMSWGGLDSDETATKGFVEYKKLNGDLLYVDALGIGSSVSPRIYRLGKEEGYDVVVIGVKVSEKPSKMTKSDLGEFYSMRDELWWRCREWLERDQTAMLPNDPMLVEELRTATYDYTNDSRKIKIMKKEEFRDKLKRSPDRADALCLTFSPYERATVLSLE